MSWAGRCISPGRCRRALGAFDRARELGENSAGNWFLRAIILDKLKQLKPALEAYQRFLAMSEGKNPDQEFQARRGRGSFRESWRSDRCECEYW